MEQLFGLKMAAPFACDKFVTYIHLSWYQWKNQPRDWEMYFRRETARYYRLRTPYPIREKLDKYMEEDTEIIIGDCSGVDADMSKNIYILEKRKNAQKY